MQTPIVVEVASLRTRAGGYAVANIWFRVSGLDYPSHGWSDFVVVLLASWVSGTLKLLRNDATDVTMHFMDGPYAVGASRASPELLTLRSLEGPRRVREATLGQVSLQELAQCLLLRSREVLDACKEREWWSSDAETLASSLLELEKEVR